MIAETNVEGFVRLPNELLKPTGAKHFLLRVKGNSMNLADGGGEKIEDSDLVLIRQQPTANNGDVIVALIDGEATIKEFSKAPGYIVLKPRSSDPLHHPIVVHKQLVSRRVNEAATLPVVATSLASIEIITSRLLSCWVAGSTSQGHLLQQKELRHGLPPQLRQASGSAPRWPTPISQRVDSPKFGLKIDTIVFRHGLNANTAATARVIELLRSEHDRRIHPHGPACRNPRRRDRDEAQGRDRRCL
jgi:hypothetical protein